jgi:peptide/nickel transport system ATP-binding protein
VKNLLEIKDLKVTFPTDDGFVQAVDGVSISVAPGAVSYTHLTLPTT